jgi:hypothetical protein
MSIYIYSVCEVFRPTTDGGKWEMASLYQRSQAGEYRPAQLIEGGRTKWNEFSEPILNAESVTGDAANEDVKSCIDLYAETAENAMWLSPPLDTSKESISYYEDITNPYVSVHGYDLIPNCLVYTLQDLELMRLAAAGISREALAEYEKRFTQVRWVLKLVKSMEYIPRNTEVRIIMWVV